MNTPTHLLPTAACGPGMPGALRLGLPTMPLAAAAAARVVFDARCAAFLSRYLGSVSVRIGRRSGAPPGLTMTLSSLAGELVVELDPHRCVAWALLDRLARKPGLQKLACALASEMLDRVSRAHSFEDVGLEVHSLISSSTARACGETVATVRIGEHEVGLLEMDPAFSQFAAEEMRDLPLPVPQALRALRLQGHALLTERTLPADHWATVTTGDIFLLGRPPLTLKWRIGAGDAWSAEAHMDSAMDTLTLETAPSRANREPPMETADALPEIELAVHFEIQTASLALQEIAALAPGHVIALDVPVDQAIVQLTCQGRHVGTGQLMAVGDHLGVRIERMSWTRDAAPDS